MQQLERQPIWLRSALMYETKMPRQKLKIILPALAYYYTTGPWRLMWVRFGYDPRKDFSSRFYQNLDYRIRTSGLKEQIIQKQTQRKRDVAESENQSETDIYPYFDAERLPKSRQAFYRVSLPAAINVSIVLLHTHVFLLRIFAVLRCSHTEDQGNAGENSNAAIGCDMQRENWLAAAQL